MLPIRKINFQNRTVCFCLCFLSSMVCLIFHLIHSLPWLLFTLSLQAASSDTATRYFPPDWISMQRYNTPLIPIFFFAPNSVFWPAGWLRGKTFPQTAWTGAAKTHKKNRNHMNCLPHRGANSKRDKYEIPITQKCADRANTRPERRNF